MSWNTRARLACVRFPHLALVLAWRAHPELTQEAVLVGSPDQGGRPVVLAASASAEAMGAQPGQDWRQAELSCPEAVRLMADAAQVSRLRQQVRLSLYDCSPLVEWSSDTEAYLDLSDRDSRFPTEASRAARLGRAAQQALGVAPAVGVGQSRFVAGVAAVVAGWGRARLVSSGQAAEFLADWPVGRLPLPGRTIERLLSFGLSSCGDCLAIGLPDLQRQLGPDGLLLHRLCSGLDQSPLHPWREPAPCEVRRVLAGPVEGTESLRFGAPELASQLAEELAARGQAAGRLRLLLREQDAPDSVATGPSGVVWDELSPPAPVATEAELLPLLLSLLSRARCRAQVIEVQALELTDPPAQQARLWPGGSAHRSEIEQAVARLHQRFGRELVWQASIRVGHPGDIPEERLVWSSR